jgi:hypothetical protein
MINIDKLNHFFFRDHRILISINLLKKLIKLFICHNFFIFILLNIFLKVHLKIIFIHCFLNFTHSFHCLINSPFYGVPVCIECIIQHDLQVLPLGVGEVVVDLFVVQDEAVLCLDLIYLMEVVSFVEVIVVQ